MSLSLVLVFFPYTNTGIPVIQWMAFVAHACTQSCELIRTRVSNLKVNDYIVESYQSRVRGQSVVDANISQLSRCSFGLRSIFFCAFFNWEDFF